MTNARQPAVLKNSRRELIFMIIFLREIRESVKKRVRA
jgi:hypothetical protein